ncbi:hypothetical protein BZG00_08020 [Salinivibrio kushneri]|uniref:Uncharacterized protein n=1 Tax=Salinivibrio kushneri TaxID=1908198 RepID=A0AB36JXG3_9GAMM|nr:hypothetical protein [Salinivibrio kushneri]OOE39838.1 hypothetical protein BZG00_08020 [Salinivibrio kushneri]QCP03422.1 hypothetical protein FCN78_13325 [Salinivibrio kushneri]
MKKTVLAISVIAFLTGCDLDSDSSSSNTSSSGYTVTGFDGYLQNAVVYIEKDNKSGFSDPSEFMGLTDESGTLTLDNTPSEKLSLQTLVLGEPAQKVLAGMDRKYETVYTTDSDRPSMPLDNEYTLHTTEGAAVISPLTDLIVLKMENDKTDVDTAIDSIQGALSLPSDSDLYVDFIDNGDNKLHKTAQILADSKAKSPDKYQSNPRDFVLDAKNAVEKISDDKISDPNYRMTVDGETVTEDKLPDSSDPSVNSDVFESIQGKFNALNLTNGHRVISPVTFFEADLTDLFIDNADNPITLLNGIEVSNTDSNYVVLDKNDKRTGLVAYVMDGKMRVGMNSDDAIEGSGDYIVTVSVRYEGSIDYKIRTAKALFSFSIKDDATSQ